MPNRFAPMPQSFPIAVIDSGAGGLSVVESLRKVLPCEDIVYFADTAHLPYGIKSPELIKRLSLAMAKKVVEISSCKLLVVACHTISVSCLKDIKKALPIPVIGMVEPSLQGLSLLMAKKPLASVGILSTKATKHTGVYREKWPSLANAHAIELIEHASTPLVYIVEEDGIHKEDMLPTVAQFIPPTLRTVDALLIGCTHFSALKPVLSAILKPQCTIVDGADFAAEAAKNLLDHLDLRQKEAKPGQIKIYVSDNEQRFINIAKRFTDNELSVTLINDSADL